MRPKFLLDEQITPTLALAATRAGLDMTAVSGSALKGRSDLEVFRAAIEQGRILVTYNAGDFVPLLRDFIHSGARIPGLITISTRTFRSSDLKGLLAALVKLAGRIESGESDPSMGLTLTR